MRGARAVDATRHPWTGLSLVLFSLARHGRWSVRPACASSARLASPVSRRVRQTRSSSRSSGRSTEDLNAIRQWARDNGYTVSDRGRIAANVVAAYREA
ncbi:histone-like nucleoid-structuring protein Lsr2 [Microbacterium sp. NPDC090225]|uniref:Lsr2 family DNA-binding protein n=1 Tax=Microbacterium sp. NPDC090225 TaxID=3364207 RepID=UPI00380AA221